MELYMKTILLWVLLSSPAIWASDLTLWYSKPATRAMEEALPIGNGRMGALIFGAVAQERLVLNEDSLWTGDDNPSGDYDTMGAYQTLGEVLVHLDNEASATDYRRELDLSDAVARVHYEAGGAKYHREFFCSHPAGVLVGQFTADKPGQLTGRIVLKDGHGAIVEAKASRLSAIGHLSKGMKYAWQLLALPQGGTVEARDSALTFDHCDGLTLIIAAGTDYAMDSAAHFRGPDPEPGVSARLQAAASRSYAELKTEHLKDFKAFFDRVSLNVGQSADAQRALPTDQRKLAAFKQPDPELEELLFQYGRYLLIACSRPGGLPANLQGLWNDSNDPPWHSDYHTDINIQMNYWPAEPANLAECHLPFFDLVTSQLPDWRQATALSAELKTPAGELSRRGFALRTSHNITGGMGWKWDKTANAWYCQHFWQHYAFGGDQQFLKTVAYPVLKETCEYWEDHLKALPDGQLVVPNGWSPEHGPDEDGVSYNQEIVWDLFDSFAQASAVLGLDREYGEKIAQMRDHLARPGIGSWGQLLEWRTEKKGANAVAGSPELDTPKDHHRHTSHLFAVYPGTQFTFATNAALAAAAKVSLDARGIAPDSDVREWSFAWRSALYARLKDGESAHRMLQELFSSRNTSPNLFGLHPPVQLDGNFGITAGVCEMLLQSQAGELDLLPALPEAWSSGSVKGLRARGGYEVDLAWDYHKLVALRLHSVSGHACKVRYASKTVQVDIEPGQTRQLNGNLLEAK